MTHPARQARLRRARRPYRYLALVALALPGTGAGAENPGSFDGEARVTAVDVVVDVSRGPMRSWLADEDRPLDPKPSRLSVLEGGTLRRVIAVERGDDPAAEPWTFVVWLDLALSDTATIRWTANHLARHAEALTALGTVEVVIADPEPRSLLSPTRDGAILAGVLSQVALQPPLGEDLLRSLRAAYLAARDDPALASDLPPPAEAAPVLAAEELRVVREQLDAVTTWLLRRRSTARRALFLANNGWDVDPGAFLDLPVETVPERFEAATEDFAQTLAAYGWSTFCLQAPPPAPVPDGLYLGRWFFPRIGKSKGKVQEKPYVDPDTGILGVEEQIFIPIIGGTYQEYKDPDKARAFLELGRVHQAAGEREEAAEAFRKAIYHFYRDARTADEEAAAWTLLGDVLEALEQPQAALRARSEAIHLAPTREADHPSLASRLRTPLRPLAQIADATNGAVVRGERVLAQAIGLLRERFRVTYQRSGDPAGSMLPIEVRHARDGFAVQAPAWARSETPESVARMRVRRLLAGTLGVDGGWPLEATVTPNRPSGVAMLAVRLGGEAVPEQAESLDATPRWLRVTVGVVDIGAGAAAEPAIAVGPPLEVAPGSLDAWIQEQVVDLPGEVTWIAVVVEDLETGDWGSDLVEVEGRRVGPEVDETSTGP